MRFILAILCPPLAVFASGSPSQAAVNAGLTLFFFIPGVWHALGIVDQYNIERRYEAVMRAMARAGLS